MLETFGNIILTVVIEKCLNWLLKSENRQQLNLFWKMQVLILCLDWVLIKTPLQIPPDQKS